MANMEDDPVRAPESDWRAESGDAEFLMFNDAERKYIAEVLAGSNADAAAKVGIISMVHAAWFNPNSITYGKGFDPFIILPALTRLKAEPDNAFAVYYNNVSITPFRKMFLANLRNPLERQLAHYLMYNDKCYDENIFNAVINKGAAYTHSTLWDFIKTRYDKSDFFNTYYKDREYAPYLQCYEPAYKLLFERIELKKKRIEERREAEARLRAEEAARARAEEERRRAEEEERQRAAEEARQRAEEEARAAAESAKDERTAIYTEADTRRNGWPPLDDSILFDPLRGHWDLFGQDEECEGRKMHGRDPARDIVANGSVCIDFGTSSTVVAVREDGRERLLRVGVSDWNEAPKAAHYENPTSLEFVNAKNFLDPWTKEYYRPQISWADLKCAHQARNDIAPQAPASQLNSIIRDLKSWARSESRGLDMVDQAGQKVLLENSLECEPPALNPIEIYAFHLGLALNNQYHKNGRIFHKYFLSFPATFDTSLRQGILAAFSRGLERSLPKTLGEQEDWRQKTSFSVREGVEEPVAYAAAFLDDMELEDEPIAFGVFDFGGGTTDFAYGTYRLGTEKEALRGQEAVMELLDVTGSPDLGGEALLHALAHLVVCQNLEVFTEKKIPFKPASGEIEPPGSEAVFGDGLTARSNAMRLMEALRPFWEEGPTALDKEGEDLLRIGLQTLAGGEEQMVGLKMDKEAMQNLLRKRIDDGVAQFFMAFRQAFGRKSAAPDQFHILLGGNSCRSPLVRECFDAQIAAFAENDDIPVPDFQIHDLLLPDDENPEGLTLKTGVALGQLKAIPGMGLGVTRAIPAPNKSFRPTFGPMRRGKLRPLLTRHSAFDAWVELGPVRDDLCLVAGWSELPEAMEGNLASSHPACHELLVEFDKTATNKRIFVRPAGPASVELAVAENEKSIDDENIRKLVLEARD